MEVGVGSVSMIGSGFISISFRSLELSLLNVRCNGALEIIAKSLATFGDIGDGVESPGVTIPCMDCRYVFFFSLMFHHPLPTSPAVPVHDPSGRHVI